MGAISTRVGPFAGMGRSYRRCFCRSAPWARFPHGLGFIAGMALSYRWCFCRSAPWARFPHGLGSIAGSQEYTGCQSKSVQSNKLGPLLQVVVS
jgi:hypothetical protein